MNGLAFDKSFAQHMVKDHKKDNAAYKKQTKSKDASGEYAQETLPALQMHLEEAQKLSANPANASAPSSLTYAFQ